MGHACFTQQHCNRTIGCQCSDHEVHESGHDFRERAWGVADEALPHMQRGIANRVTHIAAG